MKELYISPEAELFSLAPAEALANEKDVEFDALQSNDTPASTHYGDIDVDLGLGL